MRATLASMACGAVLMACASSPDLARSGAISALESARRGRTTLEHWSLDVDPRVRRAACHALGVLGDPLGAAALAERVRDPIPGVVHAAIGALGALTDGDATATTTLLDALDRPDANTRLLAARALGFRRAADAREPLLAVAAGDGVPAVRAAAATALGTLGSARSGARALDDESRRTTALALGARLDVEAIPAVRDALAWSLAELAVPEAAPFARRALRPLATVGNGTAARWTRVFALRALSAAGVTDEAELLVLTADPDPQVQLAALAALVRRPASVLSSAVLDRLCALAPAAASAHVRARAIALLGDRADLDDDRTRHVLADAAADPSPSVRRATLHACARLDPDAAARALDAALASLDPFDRAAAATAAARLPDELARPRLARALDDATPSVRAAAVAALQTKRDLPELDAWLARAAADADLAVAEELAATLTALAPGRGDLARAAFARRPSAEHAEARKALLGAIVACDPQAKDLDATLRSALDDSDLGVRLEAARRLTARGESVPPFCDADRRRFPRVGVEVPVEFLAARLRLELVTTRGRMVIALAPAIAPVHCWNLCRLVERGALDGLPFHRVVPDFVVQGGDARGDGYGNLSVWGGNLRAEFDAMPFLAGTVGMPRSAEPDSGGGQLFVTLGPAPHLDGRYTALGRVIEGLAVAELIEIGDRIERVRLIAD